MQKQTLGTLYLIPTTLGDTAPLEVLPITVKETVEKLSVFIVENEKTARAFIKKICPNKKQSSLVLLPLNKRTTAADLPYYLDACKKGESVGLLAEAGCPGIADPGAEIVNLAHTNNITVKPLVGPSSILLAMMSSGLNGQNFAFHGYLPIDKSDKKTTLKRLERISLEHNQSQLFIETPYRNQKMLDDLCSILSATTKLCIACNITLPTEYIKTKYIREWKKNKVDFHKKPTLFIIHKY